MFWLAALLLPSAPAQTAVTAPVAGGHVLPDRQVVPAAGIATEDGPGNLWVNTANMAYERDPRYGIYFSQDPGLGPTSTAITFGIENLALGLQTLNTAAPSGVSTDWALDYATAIPLPDRVAFGVRISWKLIQNGINFVSYDISGAWRPLPWFGIGAVAHNVASPDPALVTLPETGAGIALRPLGRAVILGADFSRRFDIGDYTDLPQVTARLRPIEGLYLRANAASSIDSTGAVSEPNLGVGVELYLEGYGGGGHVTGLDAPEPSSTFFVASDEPGESLFRPGRRGIRLKLDRAPAYQPRRPLFGEAPPSWLDTIELLRRAEDDKGVKGLVLTLENPGLSWARWRELRGRIKALEARGKKVLVYLYGIPSNGAYYAASAADRILVHPAGGVSLVGLNLERQYMRGTLDMVGIEPEVVRRREYKSAMETYTDHEPSAATLEQDNAMLDDLYNELVSAIAEGRGKDAAEIQKWIDGGPYTVGEALDLGLVDGTAYPDEIDKKVEKQHNARLHLTNLYEMPQPHSPWTEADQIAVIYVNGAIVPGESSGGGLFSGVTAGSATIVRQLERAANSPLVKAVVLRVDSPGGSAFASDEIWRAVERVKKEDKPVVVSMGGVAASGGYYVAAGADAIWAEPNTITGSIGVIVAKANLEGLYEHIGFNTSRLTRGRNASLWSQSDKWDPVQRERVETMVDDIYDQFKGKVRDGRELTDDKVEEVARGRVWSGARAAEIGLVDELGGFQDAIDDARKRAGLPEKREVALVSFSRGGSVLETLSPTLLKVLMKGRDDGMPTKPILDDPMLTIAQHPGEMVWMILPTKVEIGPR